MVYAHEISEPFFEQLTKDKKRCPHFQYDTAIEQSTDSSPQAGWYRLCLMNWSPVQDYHCPIIRNWTQVIFTCNFKFNVQQKGDRNNLHTLDVLQSEIKNIILEIMTLNLLHQCEMAISTAGIAVIRWAKWFLLWYFWAGRDPPILVCSSSQFSNSGETNTGQHPLYEMVAAGMSLFVFSECEALSVT
jgi:hypothetical protein